MKLKLILILGILTFLFFATIPSPLVRASFNPRDNQQEYKDSHDFIAFHKISLQDQVSWFPDFSIRVKISGTCFFDNWNKSEMIIDEISYLKSPLTFIDEWVYGTNGYNVNLKYDEAYANIGYRFLSHENFPISPFSGYDNLFVTCAFNGNIYTNMDELKIYES